MCRDDGLVEATPADARATRRLAHIYGCACGTRDADTRCEELRAHLELEAVRAGDNAALRAERDALRVALSWYPFGGLVGLLDELASSLRGHGAMCIPETCGPLGCLLAKIHYAQIEIRAALAADPEAKPTPEEES